MENSTATRFLLWVRETLDLAETLAGSCDPLERQLGLLLRTDIDTALTSGVPGAGGRLHGRPPPGDRRQAPGPANRLPHCLAQAFAVCERRAARGRQQPALWGTDNHDPGPRRERLDRGAIRQLIERLNQHQNRQEAVNPMGDGAPSSIICLKRFSTCLKGFYDDHSYSDAEPPSPRGSARQRATPVAVGPHVVGVIGLGTTGSGAVEAACRASPDASRLIAHRHGRSRARGAAATKPDRRAGRGRGRFRGPAAAKWRWCGTTNSLPPSRSQARPSRGPEPAAQSACSRVPSCSTPCASSSRGRCAAA